MIDQSRVYYTVGAFLLGAYLTSIWTSRFRDGKPALLDSEQRVRQQPQSASRFSKINDLDTLKKNIEGISQALKKGAGDVKQGIEGCIGNTPLIRIKSLSDATGCEILAKAEVKQMYYIILVVADEVK
jgi:cysteine synthase A